MIFMNYRMIMFKGSVRPKIGNGETPRIETWEIPKQTGEAIGET